MKRFFSAFILIILCSSVLSAISTKNANNNTKYTEHDGFLQLSSIDIEIQQARLYYPTYIIGYQFEKYIGNHVSVGGVVSQSAMFGYWFNSDIFITSSTFGLNIHCYPIHNSLKGFYTGVGTGFDTMFNLGKEQFTEGTQQLFFYIKPEFGWKFYLFNNFMIDFLLDYKFQPIKSEERLPKNYERFLDQGFHFGICFKFFWPK